MRIVLIAQLAYRHTGKLSDMASVQAPNRAAEEWEVWVTSPLNKDAELLTRWSKTSFFGNRPTTGLVEEGGREFVLFRRCCEESTMMSALSTAMTNYAHVLLSKNGARVPLESYLKDVRRGPGSLLGDAATMERTGGMC